MSQYFIHVLQDTSASMLRQDCSGGKKQRWQYAKETVAGIVSELAGVCANGEEGIPISFFRGGMLSTVMAKTYDDAAAAFDNKRPSNSTPLDLALSQAMRAHAQRQGGKSLVVVFFDGEPDDAGEVERLIRAQANTQKSDDEFTILFGQVGYDADGKKWLSKLDNISGCKHDIVCSMNLDDMANFSNMAELIDHAVNN